jgi:soluble lytic murein transglycosylase
MLFEPEVNLKLGTMHLRQMLDAHEGQWELTLATYNAGKSRTNLWQTWYNYREPAEFVETIPFSETRNYVQAVLRNADVYRQIYRTNPPRVAYNRAGETTCTAQDAASNFRTRSAIASHVGRPRATRPVPCRLSR